MKSIAIIIMSICLALSARSQDGAVINGVNYNDLERFIQLAKENYPQRKIRTINVEKAKSIHKAEPLGYLDMLNASYFYRPEERSAINVENPFIVNGFQFGVHLNLASFFQRPASIKQAKFDYEIAKLEGEAYDRTLENEVKRRYYEYIRVLEDMKVKTRALRDNAALLEDMQHKFERGEANFENYSLAKSSLSLNQSEVLTVEMNLLLAKDALEEIIGVKLTDFEKNK